MVTLFFGVRRLTTQTLGIFFLYLLCGLQNFVLAEEQTILLRTIDREGSPIENASVSIEYLLEGSNSTQTIEAKTDKGGIVNATANLVKLRGISVSKEGYYSSWIPGDSDRLEGLFDIVLKPVLDPIPLYARKITLDFTAAPGDKMGFDFFQGDWVAPHGSGKIPDLYFSEVSEIRLSESQIISDARYLKVWFPNPGDGIVDYPLDYDNQDSDFQFPYSAPLEGYKNAIYFKELGISALLQPGITPPPLYPFAFARIRSILETDNQINSAYYLKLYPSIQTRYSPGEPTRITMTYYLNPTLGNRNLEFRSDQNLYSESDESGPLTNLNLTKKSSHDRMIFDSPKLIHFLEEAHYRTEDELRKIFEFEFERKSRRHSLVFVTDGLWTGDLGGVKGANQKCQSEANAVSDLKDKKFKAWISLNILTAPGNDTFFYRSSRPYATVNGKVIAENYRELTTKNKYRLIDVSPTGYNVVDTTAWTNTSVKGIAATNNNNCRSWTTSSKDAKGEFGIISSSAYIDCDTHGIGCDSWTMSTHDNINRAALGQQTTDNGCYSKRRLYCFEQ